MESAAALEVEAAIAAGDGERVLVSSDFGSEGRAFWCEPFWRWRRRSVASY
jgi:hypothetical protein